VPVFFLQLLVFIFIVVVMVSPIVLRFD